MSEHVHSVTSKYFVCERARAFSARLSVSLYCLIKDVNSRFNFQWIIYPRSGLGTWPPVWKHTPHGTCTTDTQHKNYTAGAAINIYGSSTSYLFHQQNWYQSGCGTDRRWWSERGRQVRRNTGKSKRLSKVSVINNCRGFWVKWWESFWNGHNMESWRQIHYYYYSSCSDWSSHSLKKKNKSLCHHKIQMH